MLTAAQFDQLMTPIGELYEDYVVVILADIARRLVKSGGVVTATAAWQMQRILASGAVYEGAILELARLTGAAEAELRRLFQAAGVESLAFDDAVYRAAGLNPPPINLSPSMQEALLAGLRKTAGVVRNFTMSTAAAAQDAFISALDEAYLEVSTGARDYDSAIRAGVKKLAREGLRTIAYAGGHRDQVDVAVRRAVLTGVAQTVGNLQVERMRQMGVTLVQTSAHIGARPEHEVWQGRVFLLDGSNPKYQNFAEATGYGKVDGLCGINCRHSFYPFYEGISEALYNGAMLDEFKATRVEYNGVKMSVYEANQQQRTIEREVRATKREAMTLGAAGLDNYVEVMRVRALQGVLRDFTEQTGLPRQPAREGGRVELIRGGA